MVKNLNKKTKTENFKIKTKVKEYRKVGTSDFFISRCTPNNLKTFFCKKTWLKNFDAYSKLLCF